MDIGKVDVQQEQVRGVVPDSPEDLGPAADHPNEIAGAGQQVPQEIAGEAIPVGDQNDRLLAPARPLASGPVHAELSSPRAGR
jgi:hypothetical protein